MSIPHVPADDRPYTFDSELGYNSRGELASALSIETNCVDCGASMTLDIACALPSESVVLDVSDHSEQHARELRSVADAFDASGLWGAAVQVRALADSWHREG